MESSSFVNRSHFLFLWLLLLSSVYSSPSYDVWTTKTVDVTVTVDCSTSTTSSNITPSFTTLTPTHNTVLRDSTTVTVLSATGTSINTRSKSSNADGTSSHTHSTSPVTSGTVITGEQHTETVLPGAPAVTIDGTPVSLGLSGTIVIGTNTVKLPSQSSATEVLTVGSQTITIMPTGFEVVPHPDTQTLSLPTATNKLTMVPGGSLITIGTVPISLGQGGTLIIGGSTQIIPAAETEVFTVDGGIIIASSKGLVVDLPTPITAGLTTIMTGEAQFIYSTSFISIPSLTTWSETTTELPGQTYPTILPIWPCLSLCVSGYNGVMVIPKSPLPPSTVIIPAPFTFPLLTIGPNGRPTTVSMASISTPQSLSIASATKAADSVTSTMTTVPPGFYTEEVTNSLWTANTWITTTSGGTPTIVPVLVGCHGCGGDHGGIVLWNLPELPRISFQLPGFPGLPKFNLPCIKIFGITISGDCDDPPTTDEENSNNPTSNPKPSSEGTSLSPSSTLSCARTAVPSCTQLCEVVSMSGGAVTSSCSSAVCRTITACSATATTLTSYSATTVTEMPCSPTCSICRGNSANSARTLPYLVRRILPYPSDVPQDTASINAWFANRVDESIGLRMDFAESANGYLSAPSAEEFLLSGQSNVAGPYAYEVGVTGLYGCTVVVVATPETIYMAHIWETTYLSEQLFQTNALQFLAQGSGGPSPKWVGLDFLSTPQPGTTIPLDPKKQPLVMVIAGRQKQWPDNFNAAHDNYITRIRSYLQEKFPLQPVQLVTYKAAPNERVLGDGNHDEWGKVLVQYDPAQPDCDGGTHPTFRIWVAGQAFPDYRYMNYGTANAEIGRRGTSPGSCPLLPGQTGPPHDITVTLSTSSQQTRPTTISTTKTSTSSIITTISSSRLTSTPITKASISPTTSIPHSVASTLQTSFTAVTTSKPPLCVPFEDPGSGSKGISYCQCSSGTLTTSVLMMITTENQCGYTSIPGPTTTKAPPPLPVTTSSPNPFPYTFTYDQGGIVACQSTSHLQLESTLLTYCAGDRKTLSAAPSPSATTPASATPTTQPLTCSFCDNDFIAWTFTISGSLVPSGLPDLQHQMSGCGAMTEWTVSGNRVTFNLPFFMKAGCVERAIGSAGGPSLSCQHGGSCFGLP